MWSDKLKLSKQLVRSITAEGLLGPNELQQKTLARIYGGQDLIAIGPEGSGKTTTYILAVLAKLKYGFEEAPRALILVPDKDAVLAVVDKIEKLNKNKTIRTVALYATPGMEPQLDALADGCDIVVATPDRARAIYLKLALNLNKIQLFVVDDADLIVKQGLQLPVTELANSIIKCQHLVFTEVVHERLTKMIAPFIQQPFEIEISNLGDAPTSLQDLILYQVPNFRTKLNLLDLLLRDADLFTKVLVFVNTRLTAEKLYQSLQKDLKTGVAILNPIFFESEGFEHVDDFIADGDVRILVVANENTGPIDTSVVPFTIHVELPEQKETFIERVVKSSSEGEGTLSITFATDLELNAVRKIEQAIGTRITVAELPADLFIEGPKEVADIDENEKGAPVRKTASPKGAAFHEKKASNSKTYNYGSGQKAKMTNRKKH